MPRPFFLYWTRSNFFDEEQRLKKKKMKKMKKEEKEEKKREKKKKQPDLRIQSSPIQSTPIQSSQPSVVLHSTIYANLVFLPRIPIFLSFSSLALSPASLAEKPFFSSSYKASYFLSFGTDLLRDFYTFLLSTVYLIGKCGVSRC